MQNICEEDETLIKEVKKADNATLEAYIADQEGQRNVYRFYYDYCGIHYRVPYKKGYGLY